MGHSEGPLLVGGAWRDAGHAGSMCVPAAASRSVQAGSSEVAVQAD